MIWILANLRLVGYAVAALALLGAVWTVNHWRVKAGQLDETKAELSSLQQEVERNGKITVELERNLAATSAQARKSRKDLQAIVANPSYTCRIGTDGVLSIQNAAKLTGEPSH